MVIDNIRITTDLADLSVAEASRYVEYVRARTDAPVAVIHIHGNSDGTVDVSYEAHWQKFERIRRITGYLTGNLSSWNDAKQAEEYERVKHDTRFES